jgi:hypothetical protein
MTDKIYIQPGVERLAQKFYELLQAELGPKIFSNVCVLTALETDPMICHSGDYCDSNMVMDDAWKAVAGYSPCETGGEEIGVMSDECIITWDAAWNRAKQLMAALGITRIKDFVEQKALCAPWW